MINLLIYVEYILVAATTAIHSEVSGPVLSMVWNHLTGSHPRRSPRAQPHSPDAEALQDGVTSQMCHRHG